MKVYIRYSIFCSIALIAVLFAQPRQLFAQSFWEHDSIGFFEEFQHVKISASDSSDYVACGFTAGVGEMARSTDGGKTWDSIFNTGISIESIVHPTHSLIIFGGVYKNIGYIGRSTDGGITWNITPVGSTDSGKQKNPIGAIAARDSNHIFVPVSGDHYLYSSDGGGSWQSSVCPVSIHYNALALGIDNPIAAYPAINTFVVAEADTFYGSNYAYKIFRSTDMGISWSTGFQMTHEITKFAFVNSNIGFASGFISDLGSVAATATIDKTTDGGLTWFNTLTHRFAGSPELLGISFADSLNGIAVGRGGILIRTRDGGNTWMQDSTDFSDGDLNDLHDVAYPTIAHAVVVSGGGDALVYKPNGILSLPNITYPLFSPPSAPATFDVTWDPVPGATHYSIFVTTSNYPNSGETIIAANTNVTSTFYHLSNLVDTSPPPDQSGRQYEISLQAFSASNASNLAYRTFIVYGGSSSVTELNGGPIWQYLYVQNYPNPAENHFRVRLSGIYSNPDGLLTAELSDILGRKVMDLTAAANQGNNGSYSDFEIDVSALSAGIYTVSYTLGQYSYAKPMAVIH